MNLLTFIIQPGSMYKLIAFDIDGTLTDGSIYYSENGEEIKKFNAKDGMGIALCLKSGIIVAFISGRYSNVIRRRAEELGVTEVYMGIKNKRDCLQKILTRLKINPEDAAFVGDDIYDIPAMKVVGLPCALADAEDIVKKYAKFVSKKCGGNGGVREICEYILRLNGKLEDVVEKTIKELEEADY